MSEPHPTDFARQLELAWAAGFFDGEGTTYLSKDERNGNSYPHVSVGQVEREPLDRLLAALGGIGKVYGPYKKKGINRQDQYRWQAIGLSAKAALQLLWPYLTEVKKNQAQRVLDAESNCGLPKRAQRTHCPQGHEYAGANLMLRPNGWRRCRTCEDAHKKKRYSKESEEVRVQYGQ